MDTVQRLEHGELVAQLSHSLGEEKADELVRSAVARLGVSPTADFDRDDTMRILEALAVEPGLVGVVARFAKVRVALRFGPAPNPR